MTAISARCLVAWIKPSSGLCNGSRFPFFTRIDVQLLVQVQVGINLGNMLHPGGSTILVLANVDRHEDKSTRCSPGGVHVYSSWVDSR